MKKPVKVRFKKLKNGHIYLSEGYYLDEDDFKKRNGTLFFEGLTTKTKPIPVKKESK